MQKALVLLNMGGPNNKNEIEVFLKNMFNDKNIILAPAPIRKFLSFVISNSRINSAYENYKKIGSKSPLIKHTNSLIQILQKELQDKSIKVVSIMRYTPPFAIDVLSELKKDNIKDIILFPLYPQYSTTTTLSSFEDIFDTLKKINYSANITKIEYFYNNEIFLDLVVDSILGTLKTAESKKFDLIFSAHSLPKKIVENNDPYQKQIEDNVRLLKNKLSQKGIVFNKIHLVYQSKIGPVEWLEPSLYTILKTNKNKNVIIYPLSFVLDNSETDFELSIEYKELAQKLNFTSYLVCKCLNNQISKVITHLTESLI